MDMNENNEVLITLLDKLVNLIMKHDKQIQQLKEDNILLMSIVCILHNRLNELKEE